MSLDTVIYISRDYVRVYFSQNNLPFKPYSLEDDEIIPLSVFSDENKNFEIGHLANSKKHTNPSSFYNAYFDSFGNQNMSFIKDGKTHHYRFLLQFFLEYIIRKMYSDILYNSSEIDLQNFNLNLLVSGDIIDNEISFVGNLFSGLKYQHLSIVRYDYILLNYLDSKRKIGGEKQEKSDVGIFTGYVIIDEIKDDLLVSFYTGIDDITSKKFNVGKKLAIDERVELIANMLYSQVADKTNSLTNQKTEVHLLFDIAKECIKKLEQKAEVKATIKLSDGNTSKAKIKRRLVDNEMLKLARGNDNISFIQQFVKETKIESTELEFIISQNISSKDFISNIRKNFSHVYHSDDDIIDIIEFYAENPSTVEAGNHFLQKKIKLNPKVQSESHKDKKIELDITTPVSKTEQTIEKEKDYVQVIAKVIPKKASVFAPPKPPSNIKKTKPSTKKPTKTPTVTGSNTVKKPRVAPPPINKNRKK